MRVLRKRNVLIQKSHGDSVNEPKLSARIRRMAAAATRPGMSGRSTTILQLRKSWHCLFFSNRAITEVHNAAGMMRLVTESTLANTLPQNPNCAAAVIAPVSDAVLSPVPPGSIRQNTMRSAICSGVSQWCRVTTSCSMRACALGELPMPRRPICKKLSMRNM